FFFFSSRRGHTRWPRDWSSDVCSSDLAEKGIVYVHCKAGYSRTAAVAGAWLLRTGRAGSAAEAVGMIRNARAGVVIRREVIDGRSEERRGGEGGRGGWGRGE